MCEWFGRWTLYIYIECARAIEKNPFWLTLGSLTPPLLSYIYRYVLSSHAFFVPHTCSAEILSEPFFSFFCSLHTYTRRRRRRISRPSSGTIFQRVRMYIYIIDRLSVCVCKRESLFWDARIVDEGNTIYIMRRRQGVIALYTARLTSVYIYIVNALWGGFLSIPFSYPNRCVYVL